MIQEPSEKAEFYLDSCRKELVQVDGEKPDLHLQPIPDITNNPTLRIAGAASDNTYVEAVSINGFRICPTLKRQSLAIAHELRLRDGVNTITVTAEDIRGNATSRTYTVTLDWTPPIISITEKTPRRIVLDVADDHATTIHEATGCELKKRDGSRYEFHFSSESDSAYVSFQDVAGNINGVRIDRMEERAEISPFDHFDRRSRSLECGGLTPLFNFAERRPLRGNPKRRQPAALQSRVPRQSFYRTEVASAYVVAELPRFAGEVALPAQVTDDLVIDPVSLVHKVYQDHVQISGFIPGSFADLKVDGVRRLKSGKDARFAFSKNLSLGDNSAIIEYTDANNQAKKRELRYHRLPAPEEDRNLRASAALLPLAKEGGDMELHRRHLRTMEKNIDETGRFNLLERERIDAIEKEFRLIEDGWIDSKTAARAGRRMQAEYTLAVIVRPTQRDVEIYGRVIDTESSQVLARCDVYEVVEGATDYASAFARFADKLYQAFPVAQHNIQTLGGADAVIPVGSDANIRPGMLFIGFHREQSLVHPDTLAVVQGRVIVDGMYRATKVKEHAAWLSLIDHETGEAPRIIVSK